MSRVYLIRTLHGAGVPFLETHLSENLLPQGYANQGVLIRSVEDLATYKKFYAGQNWFMDLLDSIEPSTLEG